MKKVSKNMGYHPKEYTGIVNTLNIKDLKSLQNL